MNEQKKLEVKKHFTRMGKLVVNTIDTDGNIGSHSFYSAEEAIRDIENLECEFEVIF